MHASIIIPTYNNEAMLATTLSAFVGVEFPKETELIVVNNNSSDDTKQTTESFSDRLPLRYVFEPEQGLSAAKNRGIKEAHGTLLIFTDDDVRPCRNWISSYLYAYRKNSRGFFWGGPIESEFQGVRPDPRLLPFAPYSVKGLSFGDSELILADNEWFVSANLALTKAAAKQVGGFDTALGLNPNSGIVLGGEETDLQRRLKAAGYRAMYLPTASLRHIVPAKKCTLKHIAVRAEAVGRYSRAITSTYQGTRAIRGIPLWRYRRCAEKWAIAWIKRFVGRDWYPDYISYRIDRGFLLGIPKRRKVSPGEKAE